MTVVCIMGMHRSGTSIVARAASLLGLDLGARERLMDAKPDNPRGFWENQDIVRINQRVLDALGGSWDDPPPLPDGWERWDRLSSLRKGGAQALESAFGTHEGLALRDALVGWKDPRMSLLLPFWRSLITVDRCVVVLRDPRAVAASLQARGGMDPDHAGWLWMIYVAAALSHEVETLAVRYEEVFEDLDRFVDRLSTFLGVQPVTAEARQAVAGAVDPGLRRSRPLDTPAGAHLRAAVLLDDLVGREGHDRLRPLLAELATVSTARRSGQEVARLRQAVDGLDADLLEARRQVERLEGHVAGWEQQHNRLRSEYHDFRRNALQERQRLIDERDERSAELLHARRSLRLETERAQSAERQAQRLQARLAEIQGLLAAAASRQRLPGTAPPVTDGPGAP